MGKVDDRDLSATRFEKCLEPGKGPQDLLLLGHVRVEADVDLPVVEGDLLPLGKSGLSPFEVRPPPVPDTEEGNATDPLRDRRVRLPDALGDEERDCGVTEVPPDPRWDIDNHSIAGDRLVLNCLRLLAVHSRGVWADLIGRNVARNRVDGCQQSGYAALVVCEAQSAELRLRQYGPVPSRCSDLRGDPRSVDQRLVLRENALAGRHLTWLVPLLGRL